MKLRIRPTRDLSGTVKVPPSKSYTHRAVILASLAKGTSTIKNPLISDDTSASMDACRMIGAKIEACREEIKVTGVSGKPNAPSETIDAANSGTTLRLMTAVASLCDKKVSLTGDASLQDRPMQPLLDALKELGVSTSSTNGKPPVSVHGPIKGGRCRIRGDVSSQFISGLLIAAPLAAGDTDMKLTTELKSGPYLDMTLELIKKFGGKIEGGAGFRIPGRQIYRSADYTIEGDYSSAAIIFAAAAITGSSITVENLPKESMQGDRRIADILQEMGVNLHVEENSITVRGGGVIDGIKIDLSDNPDLVPPLAVIACFAKGRTVMENVGHLRFKECDRLKALSTELKKMGARIKENRNSLEIKGVEVLEGARLNSWGDHRIIMSLAVAGLRAEGETVIDAAESIPVSFPRFVECMKEIGADMETIE
ncbi:MAG: 3-phosphoshikimate 1-carboxyvinyltransferase [Candidatus Altiarchaeota archaeon]|nr:3-phosphoshikimate 1-carboxyvinyltransferase [Candidatus Altiarchaeota archaeon]